jgi:UDP-N-acetylmuramoyl-L-alanyl-D-glutamate--2,6-diaminopimelate ligase
LARADKNVIASTPDQVLQDHITGITCDSRRVKPGFIFAALPGLRVDGRDYMDQAISSGAKAILAPEGTVLGSSSSQVCLITDQNVRQCYARMSSAFQPNQPQWIAAITGTNGKTSVASFARQIWSALGLKAGSIGTLGIQASGGDLEINNPGSLTTPDPADLHETLAELASMGVDHMAIEASSHGLDQYRLDGVKVNIAAFTNLSRDHLDYHGDVASYFQAKSRLFDDLLEADGTAVLNADGDEYLDLKDRVERRGCRVISYGRRGADIMLRGHDTHQTGQRISIVLHGRELHIDMPLIGAFQIENALCALGIIMASGEDPYLAVQVLSSLHGVRGRLELVETLPNGASVYVDFAHTPDALVTMLQALRAHVSGRLIVLFGCGGDRDPGKRVAMGRAAQENSDYVILSDDNPRSEDPAVIRAQAREGCPDSTEIGDRAEAIAYGIELMEAGDLLVVAGKGHEQGQVIGDTIHPFDDANVVRRVIEGRSA